MILSIFENGVICSSLILWDFLYSPSFPSDYPERFVSQPFKCNSSVSGLEHSFKKAKCSHNLCFYFVLQLLLYNAILPNVKVILPVERSGSKHHFTTVNSISFFPSSDRIHHLKNLFYSDIVFISYVHIFHAHLKENSLVSLV